MRSKGFNNYIRGRAVCIGAASKALVQFRCLRASRVCFCVCVLYDAKYVDGQTVARDYLDVCRRSLDSLIWVKVSARRVQKGGKLENFDALTRCELGGYFPKDHNLKTFLETFRINI